MERLIYSFNIILVVLYFFVFLLYTRNFLSSHRPVGRFFMAALPAILGLHFVKLLLQGIIGNHCPIFGIYEAFSFMAFALGVIYFITERYQKYYATGAIFIGIVMLFQSVSIFAPQAITPLKPELTGIPLGIHASVAVVGLAAIVTCAIYSAIYLLMFYMLKHKRFSTSFRAIPPLETIDRMQTLSATIGLALIAFSLVVGLAFGLKFGQGFAFLDTKVIASFIVLVIFAYVVIGSWFFSFSGKKKSTVALIGFLLALFSMTIIRFYLPTFHRF